MSVQPLVIGVLGEGPIERKAAIALIEDQVEGRDVRFIFSMKDPLSKGVEILANWAIKKKIPFEAVTDSSTDELNGMVDTFLGAAAKVHSVVRATNKVTNLLGAALDSGAEARMYIAYVFDEDDEENATDAGRDSAHAFTRAYSKGIPVFDLSDGEELKPTDDEELHGTTDNLPDATAEDEADPEPDPELEGEPAAKPEVVEDIVLNLVDLPSKDGMKIRAARDLLKERRVYSGEERRGAVGRWERAVGKLTLTQAINMLYPEDGQVMADGFTDDAAGDAAALDVAGSPDMGLAAEIDPDNLRMPTMGNIIGIADTSVRLATEDSIVGIPRAEMEQYAKDRVLLLAGQPMVPPTTVDITLSIDLRQVVLDAINGGHTVQELLLDQLATALNG